MKNRDYRINVFFGALVLFLFSWAVNAQQKLSLENVLNKIEQNNPLLASFNNKLRADTALSKSAGAWAPPLLAYEFGRSPYTFDYNKNKYPMMFYVEQQFANRKRNDAREKYLLSFSETSLHEKNFSRVKLFYEAKQAFYARYTAERRLEVLEESIKLIRTMIEVSEKEMASGKNEMQNVYSLKAKLISTETMRIHEQGMVKVNTVTLNSLMNTDLKEVFELDTAGMIKNYTGFESTGTRDSIENRRSDILQMNSMIKTLQYEQQMKTLSAKSQFGMRYIQERMLDGSTRFGIMAMMTLPKVSWAAKGYKSEVKALDFEIGAMKQEKENMINMAGKMLNVLLIEIDSELKEVDNYQNKVIPAYKQSLEVSMLGYRQNTNNLMMVLMNLDELQMAQMTYIEHFGRLLEIQAEYEREAQIK